MPFALALAGGIAVPLALLAWLPQAPDLPGNSSAGPRYLWPVAAYRHLPAASVRRLVANNGGESGNIDVNALN